MDGVHHHLHPSRALWEGRATPSPSPTPPPGSASNGSSITSSNNSSSRPPFASGVGREGGSGLKVGGGGVATGAFPPVLPETSTAPPIDSNSLGNHWTWLRQQQQEQQQAVQSKHLVGSTQPTIAYGLAPPSKYEQQIAAAASGGIDRPALRGQEYRREKKRRGLAAAAAAGRRPNNGAARPTSSLMRSGSELDGQGQSHYSGLGTADATPSRRFLGIPLPFLQGSRRGHLETEDPGDVPDSYGSSGVEGFGRQWQGGGGGDFLVPEDDRRLQVSIEGTQELGKGLGGHTVYRIQVTYLTLCVPECLRTRGERSRGWRGGPGAVFRAVARCSCKSTAVSVVHVVVSCDGIGR